MSLQNVDKISRSDSDALNRKVDILQYEHKLLEKANDILLDENETLEAARDVLEKKNNSLLSEIGECNGLLLVADNRLAVVGCDLAAVVEGLTSQRYETANYQMQCDALNARIGDLNAQHTATELQLETTEVSLKTVEARVATLETELVTVRKQEEEVRAERDELACDGIDSIQKVLMLEDAVYAAKKEKAALFAKLEDAEREKYALVRKLEETVEDINKLEQDAITSCDGHQSLSTELITTKTVLSDALEQYNASLEEVNSLETHVGVLNAEVKSLRTGREQLSDALENAEERARQEMADAGECMVNLYLEQEKVKALEIRLASSNELLAAATGKIDELGHEVLALKATAAASVEDAFAKKLEIELLQQQDQEALDMCAAEKTRRTETEKERDDVAVKMVGLLVEMDALKERNEVLECRAQDLEDRNQAFESQLGRECDAHASTREDLGRMQARFAAVMVEKENQEVAAVKPSTPARRSSSIFRRPKIPLQSYNADVDVPGPTLPALPNPPAAVKVKDDVCLAKENSVLTRSPTVPLSLPYHSGSIVSTHRRTSSSSTSGYRTISDRIVSPTTYSTPTDTDYSAFLQFGRSIPEDRIRSPFTDGDDLNSPALS